MMGRVRTSFRGKISRTSMYSRILSNSSRGRLDRLAKGIHAVEDKKG